MKKIVAVCIGLYFLAMGTMFIWGFIDKQQKEQRLETVTKATNLDKEPNNTASEDQKEVSDTSPSAQTAPLPSSSNTSQSPPSTTTQSNTNTSNTNTTSGSSSSGYTWAEISKHTKASDCWIVINNKVYNVTQYLDLHPGGADLILMQCGKDATSAYNTQGGRGKKHSANADRQLATFLLGPVAN